MLDCRRIYSRFSPTLPDGVYSPASRSLVLARVSKRAYAGISELYHYRHRNHHPYRHCRTVALAAAVIYYLLKLVWPGFIAYVAASETQSTMSRGTRIVVSYSLPSSIIELHKS